MRNWQASKLPIAPLWSALSLALLAVASPVLHAEDAMKPTSSHFAYIGTYNPNGEGVYRVQVDTKSGALSGKTLVSNLPNPAQLVVDAKGQTLYVASEVADFNGTQHGGIVAYRINPQDGHLTQLNQVDSQGAGPVYLSLTPDGRHLLVANYISGSIAAFPVDSEGKLGAASSVQQDEGPAGAAKPAAAVEGSFAISDHNGPHAHMIASDPSGKFVFSTDLGLDRIYQWRFDGSTGKLTPNDPPWIAASSAGAGPRHFVFHPDGKTVLLINEEASTLTSYRFDHQKGTLKQLHAVSSLPADYKGTSFAAGLALSEDGKNLYVANRLHNSIAQFNVGEEGELKPVAEVWTRGDYPRTITLDPTGRYLYALNQRSDNVTRFSVDKQSGKLSFVDGYTPVGSPSQMVFLPTAK
ncbi:6-phosphogluconolactonase (cycloisomerase 2 family) [Serratia fonticola]|jgi:6-phosphogluconolactonase|uniref:6-phosphogluconolactonase (Cycloisomerase 2 family) n=1 Tax=Serratia fonticola TaxID=47917 RepID=A0A542BV74_SERFO|nr:lactonase family protein [Serratia fonticola]TQI82434.1 6-phosphogluconolactonase (cycloisomerase 2 family) [Serratia fonticola]TQI95546.1 6-phosphogluconolactonase (cycloisomerase 2 family) [Serratia fonticola]TVZ70042.1 6-phosphogluconolactonase (cycloisomerase 2 family) [Serratia fonticola]